MIVRSGKSFINERGNRILVEAHCDPDANEVTLRIEGPNSLTTNTITLREAHEVHRALGAIFGESEARCILEGIPVCGKCGHQIECDGCDDEIHYCNWPTEYCPICEAERESEGHQQDCKS